MEILKKDILKEIEEKSVEKLNRGVDIAVSILKHEFPFITGWDYKDKPETYRSSIYLVLMADMNLASEFYNSPIRNVYRHSNAKVAYPFSPLEISTELNEDEKYELYKVIQKSLVEIYDEIPSELRHEFESYSSEKKEPKELYIEGFIFEKPKENINEKFDIDYYRSKYDPPEEEPNVDIENMTKEEVKEWGSKYFSQKFFRLFSPKTYNYAKKKRWLHDICHELEWDECGGNNKKIYGFFFEKDGQKYVYVGITNNITKRFSNHTDLAKTKLSHFQRMVKEMEVDPKDIDFRVLFWKFLPDNRAGQIERSLVSYFRSLPKYICLNVASGGPTGEKGRINKVINNVVDYIANEKIENEEEFLEKHPEEYEFLKKTNRLKSVNRILNYRFFDQGHYENSEIINLAKKYLNKKDFQKNEPRAFGAAFRRNMLNDLFPENINESENDEIERNLEAINLILSEISWDGLCEIWVEYNEDDKEYEIRSKSTKRHFDYDDIANELGYLENTLRSMGLRTYIFTPWYVEECEDEVEFLNESEEETTTNYVPIIEEIIEPFKNEDAVCEINVWYDEEDDMYSVYLVLGTEELNDKFYYVDGIRTYRNKLARKIETEIKSYLPIDNLYVGSYGKPNCGWSPLNENWFKVPSSDYNSLEKIINLEMKEKYSWWKDIKINTLNYIELYGDVQIEAELTVDEEWGANQWREFYLISEFPGNKGWEDDGYELVRFGDIIDSTYAEVIRDNLREILRYALNIEAYNMSFRNVYLIFE